MYISEGTHICNMLSYSYLIYTVAQSCTHGNVRLVGSDNSNEGRLEVCMNGMWGTVCDDGWGHSESKVVCRQLHYPVDEPGIEEG